MDSLDFSADLPDTAVLSTISEMARILLGLDQELQEARANIKRLEARRQRLAEVDLPTALDEAGVSAVELSGGGSLSLKEELYASIPKANKREAALWLVNHHLGSLVKTAVEVQFDKGDGERAAETAAYLKAQGLMPIVSEDMNTASVKSAIKELRAQGQDVPLDLFGAYIKREAVIK